MPRDYNLAGLLYDPRVLGAAGWYLNGQAESTLLDEETAALADVDQQALRAIFEARAAGIHRPVTWSRIERLTCTCSLVVRSWGRFNTPVGHLDQTLWTPAATVVVQTYSDGTQCIAACQVCGAFRLCEGLDEGRAWTTAHTCPPLAVDGGDETKELRMFLRVNLDGDEHPDDLVHDSRAMHRLIVHDHAVER